jgi:hypothetical protein
VVAARPKRRHVYPAGETSRAAAHVLNRAFDAARPDHKWVGEHTLLWTAAGWVYLAVALGLFSRKGVGWHLSGAPDARLILAALNQAATLRRIAPGTDCPNLLDHYNGADVVAQALARGPLFAEQWVLVVHPLRRRVTLDSASAVTLCQTHQPRLSGLAGGAWHPGQHDPPPTACRRSKSSNFREPLKFRISTGSMRTDR